MTKRHQQLLNLTAGWRPPPGLHRSRPRDVALSAAGWALAVIAGCMVFGGFGAFLTLAGKVARQTQQAQLLASEGVVIGGRVTRLWRGGGEGNPRYAAYAFEVDGRQYEGTSRFSRRAWNRFRPGDTIEVRYAASKPSLNHPVTAPPGTIPVFVPYLVGLLGSVAGLGMLFPISRQRRLLAGGRAAPGVITRVGKAESGGTVHYEFPVTSGSVGHGKVTTAHPNPAGTVITVLYLPDDEHRNAIYPLKLAKPAGITSGSSRKKEAWRTSTPSIRRSKPARSNIHFP